MVRHVVILKSGRYYVCDQPPILRENGEIVLRTLSGDHLTKVFRENVEGIETYHDRDKYIARTKQLDVERIAARRPEYGTELL